MLIKENLKLNRLDDFPILENTSKFSSSILVPIIEDKQFGYKIKLNDLVEFSESNGIIDLGRALSIICEDHNINPNRMSFVVDEEDTILNENLMQFVSNLQSNNVSVILQPSKETIDVYKSFDFLDEALDYRHGEYSDDARSLHIISQQVADSVTSAFDSIRTADWKKKMIEKM